MGTRFSHIAVAIGVLACSACGGGLGSFATSPRTTSPSLAAPSAETPSSPDVSPPFVAPSAPLEAVARRFVTAALSYDAWTEEQRTFLVRLDGLATAAEISRLRHSERARLRWWVLRQRFERVAVHVTGVSQESGSPEPQMVQVEAIRVTRTDVTRVRDFVEVTLTVVPTRAGWRVDDAEGGGL